MPIRQQSTPYGDVTLTSSYSRGQYYIRLRGKRRALEWLLPHDHIPGTGSKAKKDIKPAQDPVTAMRQLMAIVRAFQEAWDQRLQEQLAGQQSVLSTSREVTLQDWVDHIQAQRQPRLALNTFLKDGGYLRRWIAALGGDIRLRDITEDDIRSVILLWKKSMKPRSVNAMLGTLKTFLNVAVDTGILTVSPAKKVKNLPVPRRHADFHFWRPREIDLALQCARADQKSPVTAELLVALGCLLGLRLEEIIMLRWDDLELEAVDPRTGKPEPVCNIVPQENWQPKTGEARTIPVQTALLEILQRHRKRSGYILEAQRKQPKRGGTKRVYRYDPRSVWERVIKRVVAAGGKKITAYAMRHSFASNLLIAGVSDTKVARWLGHADTRMVHRHYGHLLSYDDDINAVNYN